MLIARIIAAVDSHDVMVNDRPYHKGMPEAEAIAELRRCSGTQFDPDIADIMIKLVKNETITIDKNGNVIINKDGAVK